MPERYIERYRARVDRRGPDECWPWTGDRDHEGYGRLKVRGRNAIAHRVGFLLTHGWLPPVVRHTCDVPDCQNPAHWLAGDQLANIADRVERGRSARGERHGRSKLTASQVAEARTLAAAGASQRSLARRFGVAAPTMRKAIRGETWA